MTREELLARLRECIANADAEACHLEADRALLDYINDPEVTALYGQAEKWYA